MKDCREEESGKEGERKREGEKGRGRKRGRCRRKVTFSYTWNGNQYSESIAFCVSRVKDTKTTLDAVYIERERGGVGEKDSGRERKKERKRGNEKKRKKEKRR